VNVWCGVIGDRLFKPYVFDENLTGDTYEEFLRKELPCMLKIYPVSGKEPNVLTT
jgi:hypothetical protein